MRFKSRLGQADNRVMGGSAQARAAGLLAQLEAHPAASYRSAGSTGEY